MRDCACCIHDITKRAWASIYPVVSGECEPCQLRHTVYATVGGALCPRDGSPLERLQVVRGDRCEICGLRASTLFVDNVPECSARGARCDRCRRFHGGLLTCDELKQWVTDIRADAAAGPLRPPVGWIDSSLLRPNAAERQP